MTLARVSGRGSKINNVMQKLQMNCQKKSNNLPKSHIFKCLAFHIYLLNKVDILTDTPYKHVVYGTAAKILKKYRLWNTFHTIDHLLF